MFALLLYPELEKEQVSNKIYIQNQKTFISIFPRGLVSK